MNKRDALLFIAEVKVKYFDTKYRYCPSKYSGVNFLKNIDDNYTHSKLGDLPEVIFCFWTGDNPLTKNRINGLKSLEKNSRIPVELVTEKNLYKYIKSESPIHSAYEYLSSVHKSDYLRCYFMHNYGGGYSDIKPCMNSWVDSFETLRKYHDKIGLGYQEVSPAAIGYCYDFYKKQSLRRINADMALHYNRLIGCCAFIFRSNTLFTHVWFEELNRRLDYKKEELKLFPGNVYGNNYGYPIPWTSILGQIFHPLSLVFNESIIQSSNIIPNFNDYR